MEIGRSGSARGQFHEHSVRIIQVSTTDGEGCFHRSFEPRLCH